ncbi:rifin PIR protein, putative [Plasmodium reichenowi]|uniref:Rifin PIR protein, putative n=1 Tax=Plasmodium reichenowi TaxID=5854 RepID=A0A2P9DHB8_PLARE|nr:rifin PIR protein, putative [Plasmodium reichenowi]
MKVHYINILLFALSLNILVYYQRNNKSTTPYHTKTNRSLCECELYAPANYDNDPQMKKIMENFNRQTQQRFHEYDDGMVEKRKRCKDKCDKEIQKIILKDKLEKELMDKFATLHTDIQSHAIPTCVCKKSMADKVEKGCLKCGGILGTGMPELGAMGGMALYALNQLKPLALKAAIEAAEKSAIAKATKAGMKAVFLKIEEINKAFSGDTGFVNLRSIVTTSTYKDGNALVECAKKVIGSARKNPETGYDTSFYTTTVHSRSGVLDVGSFGQVGSDAYDATFTSQKGILEAKNIATVDTTYASYQTAITASIIAIVVIVLIMVIIYLILRYRRKKKMKKKLQYIKLLEE